MKVVLSDDNQSFQFVDYTSGEVLLSVVAGEAARGVCEKLNASLNNRFETIEFNPELQYIVHASNVDLEGELPDNFIIVNGPITELDDATKAELISILS